MKNLQQPHYPDNILNRFGILCLVLFLLTYLSHLGALPLDTRTDEARRALVSLEMMLSGDYISPTLNGEVYLNKPPLYNWIMIGWLKASGSFSSFWLRFPVIVAIAIFGFLIYTYARKYTNKMIALVAAFAFITNGRILIYDSFQGLIDLTFGFCMYWLMMLVFQFGEQKKYWQLFIFTYLLTAAGFMMKGLPALVFESITLLVYFTYTRRFRVLFSIQHIVSILLLFVLLGGYYYAYFHKNNVEPATLFQNLLSESTKRTVVKYGFWYSVLHFLYYPFAMVYHYAPWMLLGILLLRKGIFRAINANPFIRFNWWAFLFNFLVYWTSPEVYARYLFPLLAPLFTVLVYLFFTVYKPGDWQRKWPENIFGWIIGLAAVTSLVLPLTGAVEMVKSVWLKAVLCALTLGFSAWFYYKHPSYRLLTLCVSLFLVRLGFNWFVIDQRGKYLRQMVTNADRIDTISKGRQLYLERGANHGNFDGMSYHISLRRNQILRYAKADTSNLFITDSAHLVGKQYQALYDFDNIYADHLWLVKYQNLK